MRPDSIIGPLSDPKVRRKLRERGMPEAGKHFLAMTVVFIKQEWDAELLSQARDFMRWHVAEHTQKTKPMSDTDWELAFSLLSPILAWILAGEEENK